MRTHDDRITLLIVRGAQNLLGGIPLGHEDSARDPARGERRRDGVQVIGGIGRCLILRCGGGTGGNAE